MKVGSGESLFVSGLQQLLAVEDVLLKGSFKDPRALTTEGDMRGTHIHSTRIGMELAHDRLQQ